MELGPKGEVRWKIEGLRYPLDAQVVGRNRVLVVEYLNRQVSERDFEGKVIWSKMVSLPIACQRLPSGNTFVASRRELTVVDRQGKVVFTYQPEVSITAAQMMRNGHMVMITTGGTCIRVDGQGKQVNSFAAGPVYTMGGNIDVLPNGRVLVPEYRNNKVVEYTPEGKVFWEFAIPLPTSAVRLANGNTLVVSMMDQRVVEVNRQGQTVWEYRTEGRPWRALRR
jgi:outer membrane protein assembly factor BamB